jgi:hypothetical protein
MKKEITMEDHLPLKEDWLLVRVLPLAISVIIAVTLSLIFG